MPLKTLSALFILLMLTAACQKQEHQLAPPHMPPVEVEIVKIVPKTIPITFDYVGFAESSHLVEIRARVEGYLDKVAYTEGSLVNTHDLLFQIDSKPFEAALENSKGILKREEAVLWNAKRTKERLQPLYEQKAASLRDLDNAIAQELASEAAVQSAKAKVVQAELDLGYTTITSPISGLAGKSYYREGALITPGSQGLLTTVSVINPIWVNFNVSESDLLKVRKELKSHQLQFPANFDFDVELMLADNSIFPNKGKVDFAEPTLNQSTGTMNVRAIFSNQDEVIKPGQFVRVRIVGAIKPEAILVPQKAVLQSQNGIFVYVVSKDDTAEVRPIEAGDWYQDSWIINSGLKAGDEVIVTGVNKIMPGSKIIRKTENNP